MHKTSILTAKGFSWKMAKSDVRVESSCYSSQENIFTKNHTAVYHLSLFCADSQCSCWALNSALPAVHTSMNISSRKIILKQISRFPPLTMLSKKSFFLSNETRKHSPEECPIWYCTQLLWGHSLSPVSCSGSLTSIKILRYWSNSRERLVISPMIYS